MDSFNLPSELAYLSPVIEHLESIEPEELNECNDEAIDLVETTLRERVRELPSNKADSLLASDRATFAAWLKQHGDQAESAYFVEGLLLGLDATYLQSPRPESPPATLHVLMELPPGYYLKPSDGGFLLEHNGFTAIVMPIDTSVTNPHRFMGAIPANFAGAGTMIDSEVAFGPVHGKKRLHTIEAPDEFKSASYVLEVPGGWVHVTLQGARFDEFDFESQFHTLRVEGHSGPKKQWILSILEWVLGLLETLLSAGRTRFPR